MTVTDLIALGTAAIVLIRFIAWLLAPLARLTFKRLRHDRTD